MTKYKVTMLRRGSDSEDVLCYTVENALNDRIAESSAVRLCKAYYPEYEEINPVRTEYVGR